ncbi:MAG: hypothetical protein KAY32_08205 [Candidatus Eisenbacteria sp.]|nr:hypothetical protein [Candidatus Eisenbacteria bacterium]
MNRPGYQQCPWGGAHRRFPVLAICALCLIFSAATGDDSPASDDALPTAATADMLYQRAHDRFYEARFRAALDDIERYLEMPDLSTREQLRGLELRGACHIGQREPIAARRAVEGMLDLDPTYLMDPDLVFPPLLEVYFSVLDERGALAFPPGIHSIAVVPLKNASVTEHEAMEPLGMGLAQAIITDIVGASEVRVVERERLNYVLDEIGRPSGVVDKKTAARAGRLVGAQSFLMGSFTRVGKTLTISVHLVETETGVILKARSIDGKMEKVFDLIRELSKYVIDDLGAVYSCPPSKADASVRALMEYAAGLDLLDRGRFVEAEGHFHLALELFPDYEAAERRLRQIVPLLAAGEER